MFSLITLRAAFMSSSLTFTDEAGLIGGVLRLIYAPTSFLSISIVVIKLVGFNHKYPRISLTLQSHFMQ